MLTVVQALQFNAPLETLEQAMEAQLWEGLDVNRPMLSGAPLLAHWWFLQLNASLPKNTTQNAHLSHVARLGWRLVDKGFDVRQSWNWVAPSGDPVVTQSTIRDVFLDSNHKPLIMELERRWGRAWTAQELEWRPLTPSEMAADDKVSTQPRLIYHLLEDHLDRVKWLLAKGVDPNLVDVSGQTALFHAKAPATARRLLARGASLDVVDCFDRTPLVCWSEMGLTHGPAKVLMVAISTPGKVPPLVLEKAFRSHLRGKESLPGWAQPVLGQLKPHLTTPSVYKTQTFLELAIGQAWNALKIHDSNTFKWLLDHTPGKTRAHAWGQLAWQVLADPENPPTPAKVRSWLRLLSTHSSDPCSPTQYVLAAGRTANALLEVFPKVLPPVAGPSSVPSRKWLEAKDGKPSLMSEMLVAAGALMHKAPPVHPCPGFSNWARQWVSTHPLPIDTIEPFVRILMAHSLIEMDEDTAWSNAQSPSGQEFPPVSDDSRFMARSSLAWCINRLVADLPPGSPWPISPSLWSQFQEKLAASPSVWRAWGSALEAARLSQNLDTVSVSTANRVPCRSRM